MERRAVFFFIISFVLSLVSPVGILGKIGVWFVVYLVAGVGCEIYDFIEKKKRQYNPRESAKAEESYRKLYWINNSNEMQTRGGTYDCPENSYSRNCRRLIRIHSGSSIISPVVYCIDGNEIHSGDSVSSPVVYTIDGNDIREGNIGQIVYHIEGRYVHYGISSIAPIVYYIDGCEIRRGESVVGDVVYYIER